MLPAIDEADGLSPAHHALIFPSSAAFVPYDFSAVLEFQPIGAGVGRPIFSLKPH
jgi:hypothetical protein